MESWIHMPLAFVFGFAMGSGAVFLSFRSKLEFYRRYIETRLGAINLPSKVRRTSAPVGHLAIGCDEANASGGFQRDRLV